MSSKAKKILGAVGVWFVIGAIVAIALVAHPPTASAHNGTLSASCEGVTAELVNFPAGTHEVTFNVDGDETDAEFTGPAGSVFLPWDFTAGGIHQIGLSWSADGGGQAQSIEFDATECVPATTLPPPTTLPPGDCEPQQPSPPGEPCEPPTTVPDVCEDGSQPPCVDPDIVVVPPPPGPVEALPAVTG